MSKTKSIDQEIMNKIRRVEHDVPPGLEQSFLKEFRDIEPDEHRLNRVPVSRYGTWAAVAALVLVALLFFFPLFHRQGKQFPYTATVLADEVWVQDAYVEGKPADLVVIGTPGGSNGSVSATVSDRQMTIIWIEKIEE